MIVVSSSSSPKSRVSYGDVEASLPHNWSSITLRADSEIEGCWTFREIRSTSDAERSSLRCVFKAS